MKKLKVLELFGGIGSPRKALENLGFDIKHIDYVEIWDWAVLAYNSMFNNNYSSQSVVGWNLDVDLLVHGSPCVDFSKANHNDKKSGASMLYKETLEIIEKRLNPRPKYVVWENVKSLTTNKKFRPYFEKYLKTMESYGYKNHYKVLNSRDFGIPQNRERVFVISIRNDIKNTFDFENLETKKTLPLADFLSSLNQDDIASQKLQVTQPSMHWAIKNKKVYALNINSVAFTLTTKMMRWRNAGVIPYKIINSHPVMLSDNEYIFSHDDMFYVFKQDDILNKSTKYLGDYNDVESPDKEIINYERVYFRYLSPLESFRLMGFDDNDYHACEAAGISKYKIYHLAGNSIVVPVLEAIFKELLQEYLMEE